MDGVAPEIRPKRRDPFAQAAQAGVVAAMNQYQHLSRLPGVPFPNRQIDAGTVATLKYPAVGDIGRHTHYADLAGDGEIVQTPSRASAARSVFPIGSSPGQNMRAVA